MEIKTKFLDDYTKEVEKSINKKQYKFLIINIDLCWPPWTLLNNNYIGVLDNCIEDPENYETKKNPGRLAH